MNTIETIKERYQQLQSKNGSSVLTKLEQNAFDAFNQQGIPTVKHEEWKYTRISGAFNNDLLVASEAKDNSLSAQELDAV
ncbi:MAG TPA: Fe-S cluster assembly protein SufD, partial [Flavisolibacter sp.]|nr:Fe-S cluster assembly protein SufD [Flavisolibacter sp.]